MEFVIIWFLCGIIAAVIGARKGEGCAAFFVGFIFGPFGILFALISKGNRVKCPHCKELINKDAEICMHCHSPLKERTTIQVQSILPSPESPVIVPPPPKKHSLIRIAKDGEDWGEYEREQVVNMLDDGTLTLDDYYFDMETNQWAQLKWNLEVRK